ncbi:TPA: carbohydrate kinase [Escherichia coli]|nr:carbohydrate kinase [Escherichia coli]ELG6163961.1 carbohydrate kinase [Escherichia coli]MDO2470414.1 carbohydrate kinase [Escherichia coli]MEB6305725.1 carbohydrate kinase [Escherichia coli]HBH7842645.1 carbohydrate kinase [Escherichia coli]HDK8803119.1 carbohydrate kinase [Escherichia coli]
MHRIDTKTAQKDKFGAGKNGFTRGNPQTGTPATDLDDDYFDMLQEELCSVVEASGASLEKARHDQLLTALRALLLSRKNPFGDIKSDGTVETALENLGLGDASGYVGRLLNIQVFYSSGIYNPTPGTKKVIVEMVGGGGGGAGAAAADSNSIAIGGPGGAGSYAKAQFTSGFSGVNVIVGSGGMGGTTSNPYASSGGTSSFGNLVSAAGGDSGKPAGPSGSFPFSTVAATVSTSPSGSGVIVGTPGEGAASSIALSTGVSISSPGGSSRFGAGGFITAYGANGIDGAGYGAGGGPVATSTGKPNTALAGGNGSMGIVIVWEYA